MNSKENNNIKARVTFGKLWHDAMRITALLEQTIGNTVLTSITTVLSISDNKAYCPVHQWWRKY